MMMIIIATRVVFITVWDRNIQKYCTYHVFFYSEATQTMQYERIYAQRNVPFLLSFVQACQFPLSPYSNIATQNSATM